MSDTPDWILPFNGGYVLYFGVPDGKRHLLPVGTMYDTISTVKWNKVRWLVTESIEKHGKSKGEWGRFHRPTMERELDTDEAGVWQDYVEQWEANQ